MGVSAIGQGLRAASVRHAVATVLVFLSLFAYFYGPPLTEKFARSAHAECNRMTGATYRTYTLEWRTTTYSSVSRPHWVCHDLREPLDAGTDLGWWTGI
jgi:hypothetical protein